MSTDNLKKDFKYYNIISHIFVVCLIISSIAVTKLAYLIQFAKFPTFYAFITFVIFPLLYVLNSILTEVYGFSASSKVIWLALFSSLFAALFLHFITLLPAGKFSDIHKEFSKIFSLKPKILIVLIFSHFIGVVLNATIIVTLKIKLKEKWFALRSLVSTGLGAFVETLLLVIAIYDFYNGFDNGFDIQDLETLCVVIILITGCKVFHVLLLLPFSELTVSTLKKVENINSFEKPSWKGVLGARGVIICSEMYHKSTKLINYLSR